MALAGEELFQTYLADIERFPSLRPEEERALIDAIEAGDGDSAVRDLVQPYLRTVVPVAETYEASGIPLMDLVQEGNLGLLRAAETYRREAGLTFAEYAGRLVREALERAVAAVSGSGSASPGSNGGANHGTSRRRRSRRGNEALACSFCGRSQDAVRKLIAGPGVYICDGCVALGCAVATTGGSPQTALARLVRVPEGDGGAACSFCRKSRLQVDALVSTGAVRICAECLELCAGILDGAVPGWR